MKVNQRLLSIILAISFSIDLPLSINNQCSPIQIEHGFIEISPADYPAYLLTVDGHWSMVHLNDECVLCPLRGGTTTKPIYWPIK